MWLVSDEFAREMLEKLRVGLPVSDAARNDFNELARAVESAAAPRNLTVAGDVAEIAVDGLLTNKPDFFAWLFGIGNTTYQQIQQAIALAESDPNIKRLVYRVSSPGGRMEGLFETLGVMEIAKKPRTTVASMACSAAYAIASKGGKIEAVNAASWIGSVGVVRSYYVDENTVEITNSESPKKRPNVKTPEGVAMVQEELDALFDIFVESIAVGRGTTKADVKTNYGRGASFLARDAKRLGMIDRIQKPALRAIASGTEPDPEDATAADAAGERVAEATAAPEPKAAPAASVAAPTPRNKPMTKDELKAQHSDVYEAVREEGRKEGHAAGLKEGEANERDRVTGHLELGEQCGAMDIATAAIKEGSVMSQTLTAKYLGRGLNRKEQAERAQELQSANAAMDGAAKPNEGGESFMEQVAAKMRERKSGQAS